MFHCAVPCPGKAFDLKPLSQHKIAKEPPLLLNKNVEPARRNPGQKAREALFASGDTTNASGALDPGREVSLAVASFASPFDLFHTFEPPNSFLLGPVVEWILRMPPEH